MPVFPFYLHVSRTVQFDNSLPHIEIDGYKFHTEVIGSVESTPIIVVHGGPGQGFQYMKALRGLSGHHQVIFYDQRGAGLSPQVGKEQLALQKNLDDLDAIVRHFSNGEKSKTHWAFLGWAAGGELSIEAPGNGVSGSAGRTLVSLWRCCCERVG